MTDIHETPSRQSLRHNEVDVANKADRRMEVDGLPGSSRGQNFDRTIPGHPAMKDTADYLGLKSSLYEPEIARANIAASAEAPEGRCMLL
ncbi:hypothetical protein QFC21_002446 [Naganishia friedmannii]|uniref:Uncharacterized protein n=1 Tax=Naganishia friedmannii TaxID=89922 RepID=A0ACC2VY30_9TREE|nr:hypothetical protein QFC21_002446 [Naganishia friedmannii]